MAKEQSRITEGQISLSYKWAMGRVFTQFFEEFQKKRITGSKCTRCKRVLVPTREFCPRCFEDIKEVVQVSDTGTVRTWSLVTYEFAGQFLKPPYVVAFIDLDGADTGLVHFIGNVDFSDLEKVRDQIKIGSRVQAKWRDHPQGDIHDIEFFALI